MESKDIDSIGAPVEGISMAARRTHVAVKPED
jgi:hypothetical protein